MLLLPIMALSGFYLFCDNDSSLEPSGTPQFTGKVVDSNGDPVEGACVQLIFNFDSKLPGHALSNQNAVTNSTEIQLVTDFELAYNYPNPFYGATSVYLEIPYTSVCNLSVFNCAGECIRTLVNQENSEGYYHYLWNCADESGNGVPTGIYTIKLQTPDFVDSVFACRYIDLEQYEISNSLNILPLVKSNANGIFSFDNTFIPLDFTFYYTGEFSPAILKEITIIDVDIVIYNNENSKVFDDIEFDLSKSQSQTFTVDWN